MHQPPAFGGASGRLDALSGLRGDLDVNHSRQCSLMTLAGCPKQVHRGPAGTAARQVLYNPPDTFGSRQTKFVASFVSPLPLYTATFG